MLDLTAGPLPGTVVCLPSEYKDGYLRTLLVLFALVLYLLLWSTLFTLHPSSLFDKPCVF